MVGVAGFEPTTTCPPDKCATRLRYTPPSGMPAAQGVERKGGSAPDAPLLAWFEAVCHRLSITVHDLALDEARATFQDRKAAQRA